MRINRLKEGQLYQIKPDICLSEYLRKTGRNDEYKVLSGYKDKKLHNLPPLVYLGYKIEDWEFIWTTKTNKIHYVLWQDEIWVMDERFAKHILPVWSGEKDGE